MTNRHPNKRRKKKNRLIPILAVILSVMLMVTLVRCMIFRLDAGSNAPTLGETWIEVPDGDGGTFLVKRATSLETSSLIEENFYQNNDYIYYSGDDYIALQGVDVSFYQGDIDWTQVYAAGISFAMIRVGYRGYQQGAIHQDENFRKNLEGALAAGLDVGVYFYSQAITTEEAKEEANFVLQLVQEYNITFPIAFDWEHVSNNTARTDDISSEDLTDICLAFCNTIEEAGYDSLVYFYRSLGYHEYDMERLNGLNFWFSGFGKYPDYYYEIAMWQYSHTATVPGIAGNTDLNLYFMKSE